MVSISVTGRCAVFFYLRPSRVVCVCVCQTILHDIMQAADVYSKIHRNYVCCTESCIGDFIRHSCNVMCDIPLPSASRIGVKLGQGST